MRSDSSILEAQRVAATAFHDRVCQPAYGYCFAHVFLDWSANTVLEGAMGDGIDGDHLAASEASRAVTDVEQNSLRANSLWPSWLRMYQQIFREDTSAVIV